MKEENIFKPQSGYLMLALLFLSAAIAAFGLIAIKSPIFIIFILLFIFILPGYFIVNPNESMVLVLFGKYTGTVKNNGFYWVMPFYVKRRISLRAHNIDSAPIKVNDKLANPIKIGVVLVWRVKNTYNAAFDVDDYVHFVDIQSEAAIRKLAGHYSYDNFEDEDASITLRGGGDAILASSSSKLS